MPDLSRERALTGRVAGIDEAGRGPLAGPVVAAAVVLDRDAIPDGLDDSKALSKRRRETLHAWLTGPDRGATLVGIGQASVAEIDRFNILAATMMAMRRALDDLRQAVDHALVDGNRLPDLPCPGHAVVGGDRLSLSISAASIVAKVTRDAMMTELDLAFPGYGWKHNMGYGTAEHRQALVDIGISPHHRRSFAPVRQAMHQESLLIP